MVQTVYFITHANVQIDPSVPITQWGLSATGKARHAEFNQTASNLNITAIFSSAEQKAIDGAASLSEFVDIEYNAIQALHDNDRSATGYLPPPEFEKTADAFFEHPNESIRGWEKAIDAQKRVVDATNAILANNNTKGNVAMVAHGAVGALLLCHLSNVPITRKMDQPGSGGGNYFAFSSDTKTVLHGWKSITL